MSYDDLMLYDSIGTGKLHVPIRFLDDESMKKTKERIWRQKRIYLTLDFKEFGHPVNKDRKVAK